MSELISKKQAATAFIDGEDVEFMDQTGQWRTILDNTVLKVFLDRTHFRLKPRTIYLNGIEVPAPFEPKFKDVFYYLDGAHAEGFSWRRMNDSTPSWFFENPVWRTEEEIMQVVAALRSIFGQK